MIQLDGSYHRWLGEDGPQFTILFAVDDATGCVAGARSAIMRTPAATSC